MFYTLFKYFLEFVQIYEIVVETFLALVDQVRDVFCGFYLKVVEVGILGHLLDLLLLLQSGVIFLGKAIKRCIRPSTDCTLVKLVDPVSLCQAFVHHVCRISEIATHKGFLAI